MKIAYHIWGLLLYWARSQNVALSYFIGTVTGDEREGFYIGKRKTIDGEEGNKQAKERKRGILYKFMGYCKHCTVELCSKGFHGIGLIFPIDWNSFIANVEIKKKIIDGTGNYFLYRQRLAMSLLIGRFPFLSGPLERGSTVVILFFGSFLLLYAPW